MNLEDSQVIDGPEFIDDETEEPEIGLTMYDYRVDTFIRQTSNSIIYLGYSLKDSGKKALKFIKRRPEKYDQIKNELLIMKLFTHSRLLRYEARFPYKEYVCIVTPFAKFQSLHAFMNDDYPNGLPEELASIYFRQMLEAVQWLHKNVVCHRDIKPDNFLVFDPDPDNPNIVLADFGFSKQYNDQEMETKEFIGTPEFAAPEIYKGKPYDFSVDIWSLGISLFMMLTYDLPVPRYADGDSQCVNAIKSAALDLSALREKGASDDAVDLFTGLCAREPRARMRIGDALKHPWVKKTGKQSENETAVHEAIFGSVDTGAPGT